ncbi:MAG TPA: DNA-3-methyladenine glycosylase I, partial [candidate division Zixibacteria bacterium]|nr:DNA-3-methyladenine glycosylase I [candidate division Zixibacteria bacterium]
MPKRCEWVGDWDDIDDIMVKYHDEEWGLPKRDDRRLFEDLVLDGAQAGLSWSTILNKRENYREAFDNFDPSKVAAYDEAKIEELLQNPGIVRNRQKVNSAVKNANAFLKIQEEFGSFDAYIWGFVNGKPIQPERKSMSELPAKTELSENISKDLKLRGFNFVGPTIIYAFMQA